MNSHWYEVEGGDDKGAGFNPFAEAEIEAKPKTDYTQLALLILVIAVLAMVVMYMLEPKQSNVDTNSSGQSNSPASSDEELLAAGEGALAWGGREGALAWSKREGARAWDSVLSGLGWKPRDRALTWNKESASVSADEELLMAEGALTYVKEGAYGCNGRESALTYTDSESYF
jgi:hypothetical protein